MTSPGWTSSGRMTSSSPTAQLAFLTGVTLHWPSRSLARSVRPAQFGQLKRPPLAIPPGISSSCPHPGHHAFRIPSDPPTTYDRPSRRSSLPRSNPTTTSPPPTVTGVARYPRRWSSVRAAASSRMFLSTNGIPF
jgi:hypothetical protein